MIESNDKTINNKKMIKYENDNGIGIKSMKRLMSEKKKDKTVFKLMKRDNRTVKHE